MLLLSIDSFSRLGHSQQCLDNMYGLAGALQWPDPCAMPTCMLRNNAYLRQRLGVGVLLQWLFIKL
jgi:hypothetical protein